MSIRNLKLISLSLICMLLTKNSYIIKTNYFLYMEYINDNYPHLKDDLNIIIDKINLDVYTTYDTKLSEGIQIHKLSTKPGKNSTLIIMGHSGIGKNVYFNKLYKLQLNDKIQIIYSGYIYNYYVNSIKYINKKEPYSFIFNNNILYLITCKGKGKQLLIEAKMA